MAQFKALAEGVEVNGAAVIAVVNGLGSFRDRAESILGLHGIVDPRPGHWYPQQAWLNAFRTISETIGRGMLERIGHAIPESAVWPEAIDSVEAGLASIDVAYHMNHRGGEIGHYRYEPTGSRAGRMVCDNPYPSAFDQGIITAIVRRFAPPGSSPSVRLDESLPGRDDGAESCTYLVRW